MNNNTIKGEYIPKSVYTDLDTIFDTRLSLLRNLNEKDVDKDIENGKYLSRISDEIGNIPYKVFRGYYDQRDKAQLINAYPTYIIQMIREHIGEALTNILNVDNEEDLRVYLNTYPYQLDEEELKLILDSLKFTLDGLEIYPLYQNYDELLPSWIKEKIGYMFMYDINLWLEYHTAMGNLKPSTLMNVVCVGPTLANFNFKRESLQETHFEDFKKLMSVFTDYQLLAPKYFSAYILYADEADKINEKELKEKVEE